MILRTKGLYASGMVLQHDKVSKIKGCAEKNSKVILEYRGKKLCTNADALGFWELEFNAGEPGGPFDLKLSSGEEILEYQVYSGEVWISSGQSNAQLPMERMKFTYPDEFELAENPLIRIVTVPITWNFTGETDDFYAAPSAENYENADNLENSESAGNAEDCCRKVLSIKWEAASPSTLGGMSGTAYFFAKKLAAELKIPVGIINASQGGSPISAWLGKQALEETKGECKTDYFQELTKYENPENVKAKQLELQKNQSEWDSKLNAEDEGIKNHWEKLKLEECADWGECTVPGYIEDFDSAGIVWIKKEIELTKEQALHFASYKTWIWLGTIIDADKAFVNGIQVGVTYYSYPPRRYVVPAGTLKEGKNTITVRLQKNSSYGKIRFYEEKPYFLFTDNVKVAPCASRNVENFCTSYILPADGEKLALSGKWKMKVGAKIPDCPPGMFFEWIPTALYNGMLSPCFTQAVAGTLWYQGESDAGRYEEYKALLLKLMELWRKKFSYSDADFPFIIVQLPNWSDGHEETYVSENAGWACIRKSQEAAVDLDKNAALVVSIDAGEWNDLHPEKKRTTGTRAACQALRLAYGKNYAPAPKIKTTEIKDNIIKLTFDCEKDTLKAYALKTDGKTADLEKESDQVFGFAFILQADGKEKAVPAKANLISNTSICVELQEDGTKPEELRYLWTDSPAPVNLYNSQGMPAAPFAVKL